MFCVRYHYYTKKPLNFEFKGFFIIKLMVLFFLLLCSPNHGSGNLLFFLL